MTRGPEFSRLIGTSLATFTLVVLASAAIVSAQTISTVAGGGPNGLPALSANLFDPVGLATDDVGNYYIAVPMQSRVFRVNPAGVLTVVAGTGAHAFSGDGAAATAASLNNPIGLAVGADGTLFIADRNNHRVRRVDPVTGVITTVAGGGVGGDGGLATAASLGSGPDGVALGPDGSIFISSGTIRRVDPVTGIISTVAGGGSGGDGGPATVAFISSPTGIAVAGDGTLFIAESGQGRVRRVDAITGIITTVAGGGTSDVGDGGPAVDARFDDPRGLALDPSGALFIADSNHSRVRRVDPASGIITTIAGTGSYGLTGDGGPGTQATMGNPHGVAIASDGSVLIADPSNPRIRRVDAATGVITTVAGSGSLFFSGEGVQATNASLSWESESTGGAQLSVAVGSDGTVFIADILNQRIRRVDAATGVITTVAGTGSAGFSGDGGPATAATLSLFSVGLAATGLAVGSDGSLFIADTANNRIRRVDAVTNVITTVAGGGASAGDGGLATDAALTRPTTLAVATDGTLFISENSGARRVDAVSGIITTAFATGGGLALGSDGSLFVTDYRWIRRVDPSGSVTTIAGNGFLESTGDGGPAVAAGLGGAAGLAIATDGSLLIAERIEHRIRRIDAVSGIITTVVGNGIADFTGDGGPAVSATLNRPNGVAVAVDGAFFIADSGNARIRRVLVGDITPPVLTLPSNLTIEAAGASGAVASFTVSANDAVDGPRPVTCIPTSGSNLSIGITQVSCSAADTQGNIATGGFTVTVRDTTRPVLTLPGNLTVEATASSGAAVSFTATATDLVDGTVTVICAPASGATFPLGPTLVTCTATDAHANTASGTFTVTIQDTGAPVLTLPANITMPATSPAGAVVTYSASANDARDGARPVTCSPTSGSTFAIGTTTVNCSASDTQGNTASGSFSVTIQNLPNAPDLVEFSVSSSAAAVIPGGTLAVTDTARNQGGLAAGVSQTRYYLGLLPQHGAGDRLLTGARSVPSLAAGNTSSGTATVTVPSSTPTGTYYLFACADDTKVVNENNETNNCASAGATLLVTRPDLAVTAMSTPATAAKPGSIISITDTTQNLGGVSAAASTTRYYLSADQLRDGSDKLLSGTRVVPALAAGATSTGTVNVTIPPNVPLGAYYLLACADDLGVVTEAGEGNNCTPAPAQIQISQIDLLVTAITAPPTAVQGLSFTVTDTVKNQGAIAAGPSTTRYYFSADATRSAEDLHLIGSRAVPSLAAGASNARGDRRGAQRRPAGHLRSASLCRRR